MIIHVSPLYIVYIHVHEHISGHKDVVELLLSYNSNIEHQNKAGCTPLMLAARYADNIMYMYMCIYI